MGDVFHSADTFWRKEAETLLVLGPVPTQVSLLKRPEIILVWNNVVLLLLVGEVLHNK